MRIFFIILGIISCILVDSISKVYFDDIAWKKYCYPESSQLTSTIVTDIQASLLPIGMCTKNIQTGWDFYGTVYKSSYIPIFGEYVGFQLSYNRWIAFSLPLNGILLQIITIFLILGIFFYYIQWEYRKNNTLLNIWYSLILAGALSHGYERIFNGFVVDFISIKYFAILNFADIFISIGACFIFFVYYVRKQ